MNIIQTLAPELNIVEYNELQVLNITHPYLRAQVALQGAQLLSWQPSHTPQDVLWLSDVEPFQTANAIRGGVPICYPWFGGVKQPPHGTARIRLWELAGYQITHDKVRLELQLYRDDRQVLEAQMVMELGTECRLAFTHLQPEAAQVALHSYFNLADITQTVLHGLPTHCFNALTQQSEQVPSPREIREGVDCVYALENAVTRIEDKGFARHIEIEHLNASDIVVWNPWHKPMSSMSPTGYQTMVCVETARINRLIQPNETLSVCIRVRQ